MATVFHLFGRYGISPEYAVTEEDTLEFMHLLQSDVKRPQNLFRELAQRDLLMLGNSFTDWVGRFFLRLTKQERVWVAERRATASSPMSACATTPACSRFLRQRSPSVKVYTAGAAVTFVSELRRRWDERAKKAAQPAAARRRAGRGLPQLRQRGSRGGRAGDRRALVAGVDVWFDRERCTRATAGTVSCDAIVRCARVRPGDLADGDRCTPLLRSSGTSRST